MSCTNACGFIMRDDDFGLVYMDTSEVTGRHFALRQFLHT